MLIELHTSGTELLGQIAASERHYEAVRKGYLSGKKLSIGTDALNEACMETTMDAFIAAYLVRVRGSIDRLKANFAAL